MCYIFGKPLLQWLPKCCLWLFCLGFFNFFFFKFSDFFSNFFPNRNIFQILIPKVYFCFNLSCMLCKLIISPNSSKYFCGKQLSTLCFDSWSTRDWLWNIINSEVLCTLDFYQLQSGQRFGFCQGEENVKKMFRIFQKAKSCPEIVGKKEESGDAFQLPEWVADGSIRLPLWPLYWEKRCPTTCFFWGSSHNNWLLSVTSV